jgi:hypothetical protein
MLDNDPLINLLQTADAASTLSASSADLADHVRSRHAKQLVRAKRLKVASCAAATAGVVLIIALLHPWQPPAPPRVGAPNSATIAQKPPAEPGAIGQQPAAPGLPDAEIAILRAESDQLAAEAAALENQISAVRVAASRQELREAYRRQLAINVTTDAAQPPIDRAAAIALCQGDFYWEVQQNRAPAQAAYQSILDNFPTSSLASVARARLQQLQLN